MRVTRGHFFLSINNTDMMVALTLLSVAGLLAGLGARPNEIWTREQEEAAGIVREHIVNPLPKVRGV